MTIPKEEEVTALVKQLNLEQIVMVLEYIEQLQSEDVN